VTTRRASGIDGFLVVDKPAGLTSHDVVGRVRRWAGTRKVGHAGTLDPMATGVLLVGVNKATRLLGHLALTDKGYDATVRLGATTTTDDAEGEMVSSTPAEDVDQATVRAALARLVGDIDQVPSSVSAIKVDGRRAYRRVLAGETVELPARRVTVHEIAVGAFAPHDGVLDVDISVRCSTGTYIRAIARDLGAALGIGGHLASLRRTSVGPVGIAEAVPLGALEEPGDLADPADPVVLQPLPRLARRFFPSIDVDEAAARDVGFGRSLPCRLPAAGPVAVLGPDGEFLALYATDGERARPVAVFVG